MTDASPVQRARRPDADPGSVLAREHRMMLAVARRASICEDDAQDAVQAAAERYLRHHHRVAAETRQGWLLTVARHEALRVRERRVRAGVGQEPEAELATEAPGPGDDAAERDRLELAREALAALKPSERLALLQQAEGHSYEEIAHRNGWSRTKVNRALTEGRAALRRRAQELTDGEACRALAPARERLVAGRATGAEMVQLRRHVRRCGACRAELRLARGGRLVLLPPLLVGTLPAWLQDRVGRAGRGVGELAGRLAPGTPGGEASAPGLALGGTAMAVVVAGALGVSAGVGGDLSEDQRAQARAGAALAVGPDLFAGAAEPLARRLGRRGAVAARQEAARRRALARRAAARRAARRADDARDVGQAVPARAPAPATATAPRRATAGAASTAATATTSSAPARPQAAPAPAPSRAPAPAPAPTAGSSAGSSSSSSSGAPSAASEFGFE